MRESGRDIETSRSVVAIARAEGRLSRLVDQVLAPAGLSGAKFNVLMELAASPDGALPLHQIAGRLQKSPPNITSLIDRLEVDGLVRRTRDAADRRVVTARITERGWVALREGAPRVFALEKRLVRSLSTADRTALVRLLETLLAEAPAPETGT